MTSPTTATPSKIAVPEANCEVSALTVRPEAARCLFVLAHGAGAGMTHRFLEQLVALLAERDVATLRYQFPYTEAGKRRPDRKPVLLATVRAALEEARRVAGGLPILAGGKSMGGRMTSTLAAEAAAGDDDAAIALEPVRGLVFVGFPLHPPRKPAAVRAEHLWAIDRPMLFLQGTRDTLAELELLRPICDRLGDRATLHIVEGGDHSFHVLKRSGRTDEEAMRELADTTSEWSRGLESDEMSSLS